MNKKLTVEEHVANANKLAEAEGSVEERERKRLRRLGLTAPKIEPPQTPTQDKGAKAPKGAE